jgi:RNA polymerase-binding protein DksA
MKPSVGDAIEETLRRRRHALVHDATEHETALRAMGEQGEIELGDRAQEDQLDRVLSRLDDRERGAITEIDAALDRIAAGTYGRCARCHAAIGAGRLAALPAAALCIRCAARLEVEPADRRPVNEE